MNRPVSIIDTTLRDGEQAPGVVFSADEKIVIAEWLAALGVHEIEVGTPARGPVEIATISRIAKMQLGCRTTAWCRATMADLEAAARCGVDAIHVSVPTSRIHLDAFGKNVAWLRQCIAEVVPTARKHAAYVSVGLQDASRTDLESLIELVRELRDANVGRIRLADTVGVWTPFAVRDTFAALRDVAGSVELGFHGHNDLGMATANALAALRGGADSIDVTVNGLGERAGNTPLEQIVALQCCGLLDTSLQTEDIAELCEYVARASGRSIPPAQPVTGDAAFRHESGIHVRGLLADERTYEAFSPAHVGRARDPFVIGTHTGTAAIRHTLAENGVDLTQAQAAALLPRVRRLARRQRRPLTSAQLRSLAIGNLVDNIPASTTAGDTAN